MLHRHTFAFLFLLCTCAVLTIPAIPRFARAQEFPADWKFVTLRTPHFEVIVPAAQQELGQLYARKLEKAHVLLKPMFSDFPERTIVVLADKTDLTNGYATRLPYPHIFLYPVLPGPQESLGESGDWMLELAAHEYAHILTFEAVSGVMEPLQSIFGTILSPNLLLPTWWKEGMAVQVETMVSNGGRLRSAYQDGVVRSFVNEGLLGKFDLAQINEALPDWPRGMRSYLFGSVFWSQAVAEKGVGIIDRLHQRHGGRVPYFIEAPAREELGDDYEGFYIKAMMDLNDRSVKQIARLNETPMTAGEPLKISAQFTQGPRISPDGERMALIVVTETDRREIRVLKRPSAQASFVDAIQEESLKTRREDDVQPASKDAPPSGSISRVEWYPDGKKIVFDKADFVSRYESFSDLWVFDLDKEKSERLTTGLRAREPFVQADGKGILFVGLEGGRTWLGRWDLEQKKSDVLWKAGWQERISFPVQLKDGRIVFSVRTGEGVEGLRILSPGASSPEPLLNGFLNARFPEVMEQGLLFTSSANGVHNLYLSSADMKFARPVSHVLGSALSSTKDRRTGDYYATLITAQGPTVQRLNAGAVAALPQRLPTIEPLLGDRYPVPAATPDPEVEIQVEDYAASSYLRPRYWIPFLGISAVNNTVVVDAATSGFDPLKKHVYALNASYDTGVGKGSFSGSYQNNVLPYSITTQALRTTSYLISTSNPIIDDAASISVGPDLFKLNRHAAASIGWQWRRTDYQGGIAERTGPSLLMGYSDYGRSGTQISPEEGGSALGGIFHYLPGSNRLNYTQYLLNGSGYWSKWLPKRHAVFARLNSVTTADTVNAVYGTSTTNFFLQPDSPSNPAVMRGYRVGHFYGKSLYNVNLEYRFPMREIRRGRGTDPLYITRVHGAVFVDTVALDGFAYRPKDGLFESVTTSKNFSSAGLEARIETTIGYFLPLNFIVGGAQPLSKDYSDGGGLLFALQMGRLF